MGTRRVRFRSDLDTGLLIAWISFQVESRLVPSCVAELVVSSPVALEGRLFIDRLSSAIGYDTYIEVRTDSALCHNLDDLLNGNPGDRDCRWGSTQHRAWEECRCE